MARGLRPGPTKTWASRPLSLVPSVRRLWLQVCRWLWNELSTHTERDESDAQTGLCVPQRGSQREKAGRGGNRELNFALGAARSWRDPPGLPEAWREGSLGLGAPPMRKASLPRRCGVGPGRVHRAPRSQEQFEGIPACACGGHLRAPGGGGGAQGTEGATVTAQDGGPGLLPIPVPRKPRDSR